MSSDFGGYRAALAPQRAAYHPHAEGLASGHQTLRQPELAARRWHVAHDGPSAPPRHRDAGGPGALDGIAVDAQGNLWCGWGSDGSAGADAAALDGVRVFGADGAVLGHVGACPSARALRQSVLWRRHGQPALHGQPPFAVRALHRYDRRLPLRCFFGLAT